MLHCIIFGSQGCGKTRNAKLLMSIFNCARLIDDMPMRKIVQKLSDEQSEINTAVRLLGTYKMIDPVKTMFLTSEIPPLSVRRRALCIPFETVVLKHSQLKWDLPEKPTNEE